MPRIRLQRGGDVGGGADGAEVRGEVAVRCASGADVEGKATGAPLLELEVLANGIGQMTSWIIVTRLTGRAEHPLSRQKLNACVTIPCAWPW
jgi:hypothetical protein